MEAGRQQATPEKTSSLMEWQEGETKHTRMCCYGDVVLFTKNIIYYNTIHFNVPEGKLVFVQTSDKKWEHHLNSITSWLFFKK